MDGPDTMAFLAAVLLAIYLTAAMLFPERFA
ncbi:MAG: potassium-transporting ATPase subunit F [Planctomyces sp.]|jgi:K+-transporting ATPase KdpF subunit